MFYIHAQSGPEVLVDMDGVLVDFIGGLQTKMAAVIGPGFQPIPLALCNKYILQDVFGAGVCEVAHRLTKEPGFFRELPPFPGALDALQNLAAIYPTYLCSTPYLENPTGADDKLAWVREHLGREWLQRVHLVPDKTFVRGAFLIDDKPSVTGALIPSWKQLQFDNGCAYCRPGCGVVSINWSNWRMVMARQVELRHVATF